MSTNLACKLSLIVLDPLCFARTYWIVRLIYQNGAFVLKYKLYFKSIANIN
jgi:hypothetical protein